MSLFDVSIFNADSSSYKNQPLTKVFEHKRNIKKQTYSKAAEAKRATFTPFIATCDAALDKEAETYIKHLASLLSKKWKCSDAQTVGCEPNVLTESPYGMISIGYLYGAGVRNHGDKCHRVGGKWDLLSVSNA